MKKKDYTILLEANKEAAEILMKLMSCHGFLQLDNKTYDVWSNQEAAEVVADLIILLNSAGAIQEAHTKLDWGK